MDNLGFMFNKMITSTCGGACALKHAVQKQHGIPGRSVGAYLFMCSLQGLLMHGRYIFDHLQRSIAAVLFRTPVCPYLAAAVWRSPRQHARNCSSGRAAGEQNKLGRYILAFSDS
jgi:hypothetical protein